MKLIKCMFAAVFLTVLVGCDFDEGWVGRSNSQALREAEKYWKIKAETVVPLKEVPIDSGTRVTYSTDGKTFDTIDIHHQSKGLEFYTLNHPEEQKKIQKRYDDLVRNWEVQHKKAVK